MLPRQLEQPLQSPAQSFKIRDRFLPQQLFGSCPSVMMVAKMGQLFAFPKQQYSSKPQRPQSQGPSPASAIWIMALIEVARIGMSQ